MKRISRTLFCSAFFLLSCGFGFVRGEASQTATVSEQKWMIEGDYGYPLLTGLSLGYILDKQWEFSAGWSLLAGELFPDKTLDSIRFTVQGRYNLGERKNLVGDVFQPYLHFGYDLVSATTKSGNNTSEHDLLAGVGLEYFFIPNMGFGLTIDYMKSILWTTSSPGNYLFYPPHYVWNSGSSSTNTSIFIPNFYLQLRL